MSSVKVRIQDLVSGEDLTGDETADVPDEFTADGLVKSLRQEGVLSLSEGQLFEQNSAVVTIKQGEGRSEAVEVSGPTTLAQAGVREGDVLGVSYRIKNG
jgi:hypothetical protein